jgi:4-aminobutyrate aminotransferase-like enzyme
MLTFMNQPLAAAAGLAVLEIMEEAKLADRATKLGVQATDRFRQLARRFDVIGDVRGPGLFIGIDFVENLETKVPATAACRKAWEFAIDNGLITQFGGFGVNVLKLKPPLTTPQEDFERMLDISEDVVAFIQKEVDQLRTGTTVAVPQTVGN